ARRGLLVQRRCFGRKAYAYVDNDPLNLADPTGMGPIGWIVELGETTMRFVRPLFSQADAVAARRSGLKVLARISHRCQLVRIDPVI
ncbi:MAG: hypothetical protein ACREF3_20530, partial [Acetobacteraceae bacterium]